MRIFFQKISLVFFIIAAFAIGWGWQNFTPQTGVAAKLSLDEQEATILAIKKVTPAVVNIAVAENVTVILKTEQETKQITQKEERGQGTGFLISNDGYILTNKHVIQAGEPTTAEYAVTLHNGKKYYAQFIGIDPLKDLAVLKIFDKNLPFVELGDSDKLEQGMSVIAIGNALGKYQNTVTKGIISGLDRSLTASDNRGKSTSLENVIQTDAEINQGNSGGPLVNLDGQVVGINTAIDQSGASIGFAIPVNDAKPIIKSIRESNRIIRTRLGVQYIMLTEDLAKELKLTRTSGAFITGSQSDPTTVIADSPAAKAGLKEGDIIFEINAIKIDKKNTLSDVLQRYKPGNRIGLKVQRGDQTLVLIAVLDEFKAQLL